MNKRFLLLVFLSISTATFGQVDPHFSQYYVYPSFLNPALTGIFNGTARFSAIYRNQWNAISTPFTTKGVSADFSTTKNINIGFGLINQTAGNGGYSFSTGNINIAYTGVKFGEQGYGRMVLGLQVGMIDRRFNPSKLSFGDQWNPVTGYSPFNPTSEIFQNTSATSLDVGAGALFYDANPTRKANLYIGGSIAHLTRPQEDFFSSSPGRLPYRVIGHAGARLSLSDRFSITPNALYLIQGNAREIMVGAFCNFSVSDQNHLLIGANYRLNDALSPYLGLTLKTTMIGLSYDINTSNLGRQVGGTNAFEVSISFFSPRKIKTPDIDFVCPRL
jgi:type IX secretion system PorP/SprF family membrane protein